MLTDTMKKEMLEDGLSKVRRADFAVGRELQCRSHMSIDEYIQFLNGIQKVFGPFPPRKPSKFTNCKL